MRDHPLSKLFDPSSIAVFGASERAGSVGGLVVANLLRDGFAGAVVPVNPRYALVHGLTVIPGLERHGRSVDLAVIATPAASVPQILRDCAAAGTRHAIVLSAGFGEGPGVGAALQAELKEIAESEGIQFQGPNCLGLIRPSLRMNATFLQRLPPAGGLALVSQSGALCAAIADWAAPHGLGFSAMVSLGNAADIGFGDIIQFLATDPKTTAILAYVEGVRNARKFVSAIRAASITKPVIVLKAGRHAGGAAAACTHTGALIGSDAVFEAAIERAGGVRVATFGELFGAAEILTDCRGVRGNRLAIVTNGGGAAVLAADRAGDLGVELASPTTATIEALDQRLPAFWSRGNPVDLLGDATATRYAEAVSACLRDGSFDGVLVMLTPQAMTDPEAVAAAVIAAAAATPAIPVFACFMGETSVAGARDRLNAAGIPDFDLPERAVEAFAYLARHYRARQLALELPGPRAATAEADIDTARAIIATGLAEGRTLLSDVESKAVLRAFRIPCPEPAKAATADDAVRAAATLGHPVALKIDAPQISHKTEVGGVRLGLGSDAEVRAAFDDIVASARRLRPDTAINGVTVEPMARVAHPRELLVGVATDPVFGPTLSFGAGGSLVEVLRDTATALPPLNDVLAERLIDKTRIAGALGAFRDLPAVDRAGLIDVLIAVSEMIMALPQIAALDINPLFAGSDGVFAVDARIEIVPKGETRPPLAVKPYPEHLQRRASARDGTPVTIGPLRPEDAQAVAAFVDNMSARALRNRFLHSVRRLSAQMLAQLTLLDYATELALVARAEGVADGPLLGISRYVRNPDDVSCEFAVAIADAAQGKGLGTQLMQALMDAARGDGLDRMEGYVLADNQPMRRLVTALGFAIEHDPGDQGVVHVHRDLA